MPRLDEIIPTSDVQKLSAFFGFDAGEIDCEWKPISDGPLQVMASCQSEGLFSSKSTLLFDPSDFPHRQFTLQDPLTREVVAHEVCHAQQNLRGFWQRLKHRWWNRTIKDHGQRPHEAEAYDQGKRFAAQYY